MQLTAHDEVGRYVAASRDGELRFFNTQLHLLSSYRVQDPSYQASTPASVGVWVTDMVYMLNVGVLAVACTPGFIALYSSAGLLYPIVVIDQLEISPSSADYWSAAVASSLESCTEWGGDTNSSPSIPEPRKIFFPPITYYAPAPNRRGH